MANTIVAYSSTAQVSRSGGNPDATALSAAMAVLVADAASPTQAHVTTANNALTAYLAAATTAQAGSVLISYDPTLTKNQIKSALAALMQQIEGTN